MGQLKYNGTNIYHITYNKEVVKEINYNGTKVWDYRSAYQNYYSLGYVTGTYTITPNATVQVATSDPYLDGTSAENRIARGGVIAIYNGASVASQFIFKGTQTSPKIDTYAYLLSSGLTQVTYGDDEAGSSQPKISTSLNKYSLYYIAYSTYNVKPTQPTLSYSLTQMKNKLLTPSMEVDHYSLDSSAGDYVRVKITNNDSDSSSIVYYWDDSGGESIKTNISSGSSFYVDRDRIFGTCSLIVRCQSSSSTMSNSDNITLYWDGAGGSIET